MSCSSRPRPVFVSAAVTALVALSLLATDADAAQAAAKVDRVDGLRAEVSGPGVARWVPGLVVWIHEPGGGLLLSEARVRFRQGQRAVLTLAPNPPAIPKGARVEPRYLAEARLYRGRLGGSRGAAKTRQRKAAPGPRVWHTPPQRLAWGSKLWLELVADARVRAPVVRWRIGRTGPFASAAMKPAADGRWTAELAPGRTPVDRRVLQYYIGASVRRVGGVSAEVVSGHAARPHQVRIDSRPRPRHRSRIDHVPPSRWTHQRALPITARIDKRYTRPVVFFRPRGGGTFDVVPMKRVTPEVWRAVIPGKRMVVPGVSYYLAATDEHGITRPIWSGAHHPRNVRVTRGKVLSTESQRNRVSVGFTSASHGASDEATGEDAWQRIDLGLERMFFGFLVGRIGASATWGSGLQREGEALVGRPIDLYGGYAGLELRAGDYLSASSDLLVAIHNGGAGLGVRLGGRIGDEAGANLSASWAVLNDLGDAGRLLRRLRLSLSTPIGQRLRLAGVVVHEDVLQDASEALRFQLEGRYRLTPRFAVQAHVGLAGRDADHPGATTGLGLAFTF